MEIDFGGIGKEYAVDRALGRLAAATTRPVLVNFGGDLAASAPRADNRPWQVGVTSGFADVGDSLMRLRKGGVATSGDAHRFVLRDGVRYPHILNPRTGWPVVGGPRAVTVASSTCTEAGVLSTMAILHGANAEKFLRECGAAYHLVH